MQIFLIGQSVSLNLFNVSVFVIFSKMAKDYTNCGILDTFLNIYSFSVAQKLYNSREFINDITIQLKINKIKSVSQFDRSGQNGIKYEV